MPQTVPSAGFTPPFDYTTFTADYFDLSLLPSPAATPNDAELPASPDTLVYTPSPPSMFHSANDTDQFNNNDNKSSNFFESSKNFNSLNVPQLFTSFYPNSPVDSKDDLFDDFSKTGSLYSPHDSPYQQSSPLISHFKEEPITNYQNTCFPLQSPISPPSSCTSYSNHSSPIYPQSVSPMNPIKSENSIDLNESLKEFKLLQKSYENSLQDNLLRFSPVDPFCNPQIVPNHIETNIKEIKTDTDHQLLREVLRDTSFQKKFNLRPFTFGNIASGFVENIKMEEGDGMQGSHCDENNEDEDSQKEDVLMSTCNDELAREKIDPVLSLAFEQMQKEVNNTCSVLGISTDPTLWSSDDVKEWLLWTLRQFNLAPIQMEYFNMNGQTLAELSDNDFIQRAPEVGGILHAQLEIWKAASYEITRMLMESPKGNPPVTPIPVSTATVPATVNQLNQQQWTKPNSNQSSNTSSGDISDDDEEEVNNASTSSSIVSPGKATTSRGSSGGGSHIHLWQFLKELLASPTLYGSAIRWLDRGKGVFKIEDSVRVARLWGKRKNRPAMNYDKLSRSIRQYYKKGIMKKTERSQRLVYQFCHPYCL